MRASRLLSILMTLQAKGRVTAQALADEAEVSVRTIYRDIEALSAAGVPVYAERGSEGGYRLLDGYRTRLTGLSAQEAEALFLAGLSGPAAELGLGAAITGAQNKLLAAMPSEIRDSAERMRGRFLLDAPAWFAEAERPAHLALVAQAVWARQPILIRYRSWKGERERRVEPLGVVLKSGAWYLVGQVEATARTYRIARMIEVSPLDERFERPASFDLSGYWAASVQRLEAQLYPNTARMRLSPMGVKMAPVFLSPTIAAAMRVSPKMDPDGWREASLPIGSTRQAASELLRFGAEVEVLEPADLRAAMARIAEDLRGLYRGAALAGA